jgi:Skp family chaperone for outer membrane proteins
MKRIYLVVVTTLLATTFTVSASAQSTPATKPAGPDATVPDSKIVLIDTSVFADETKGIARYVSAVKTIEREFAPRKTELTNMRNRLEAISKELNELMKNPVVQQAAIAAKRDEGEQLELNLKRRTEEAQAAFEKRSEVLLSPISQHIANAIEQFAVQRGYTMVMDLSKIGSMLLSINSAIDVTEAFVADYNSKNPATPAPNP